MSQSGTGAERRELPGSLEANRRLDRWLRINADGTVTVFPGKIEIGQGILTALIQIVAEELDVDVGRIRLAPTDTSYSPDEGITSGSRSIQEGGIALRYAAAEARDILLAAAPTSGVLSKIVRDRGHHAPAGPRHYWTCHPSCWRARSRAMFHPARSEHR